MDNQQDEKLKAYLQFLEEQIQNSNQEIKKIRNLQNKLKKETLKRSLKKRSLN
jgi:prefoldin subunit 5